MTVNPLCHLRSGQLGRVDGKEAERRLPKGRSEIADQVRVLRQRNMTNGRHIRDSLIVGDALVRAIRVELSHQHDIKSPIP